MSGCYKSTAGASGCPSSCVDGNAAWLGSHGKLYGADKLLHRRHTPGFQLAVHLQQGQNGQTK